MKKKGLPVIIIALCFITGGAVTYGHYSQYYSPQTMVVKSWKYITGNSLSPKGKIRKMFKEKGLGAPRFPNETFQDQRAFPHGEIKDEAIEGVLEQALMMRSQYRDDPNKWENVGPDGTIGRINVTLMSPTNMDTMYVGTASGGVWKSVNKGSSWVPIFDEARSLSIGAIEMDPTNSLVLYVGTGETNAGGGSLTYPGYGLYKTMDGGQSWRHCGLEKTHYIGEIAIDPKNTKTIFVAGLGKLFGTNPERGIFRSKDGGDTWEKVLFVNDSAGGISVAVDPQNPQNVFACIWERIRHWSTRRFGGASCGIYRSKDGGNTWQKITGTGGLPEIDGKASVSIAPSNPKILYIQTSDVKCNFKYNYKSTDGGDSWTQLSGSGLGSLHGGNSYWYTRMFIDPKNPEKVFTLAQSMYRTTNGGSSWQDVTGSAHVDQHAVYMHPMDPNFILMGNDGGVYISTNGGTSWRHVKGISCSQCYSVAVASKDDKIRLTGLQDNGVYQSRGSASDWSQKMGGDGEDCAIDPSNNSHAFAATQYGAFSASSNGGSSFGGGVSGLTGRKAWFSPVVFDPTNSYAYIGTNFVMKSTTAGGNAFKAISKDLTNGDQSMVVVGGSYPYGVVYCIAARGDVVWAGTDDANVWKTEDGGSNWAKIAPAIFPKRWVSDVAIDPRDSKIVYVLFSGYRFEDYIPHILRTTDAGANWKDISGNLPEGPLNRVVIDPKNSNVLYVASDFGVFYTRNLGESWAPLGSGLPFVSVNEIALCESSNYLYAGTYGRSVWRINVGNTGVEPDIKPVTAPLAIHNAPNPFRTTTTFAFSVDAAAPVELKIYTLTGQLVKTITKETLSAGNYKKIWDRRNEEGVAAAAGRYIYRLRVGNRLVSKELTITN